MLDALRDLIDQIEFIARNRRIGAHDDECRVDVRDELTGCCRVGFEDRAEPWRIDKAKTGFEKRVGQERLRAENAFDVLGILFLGDEGDEIAQRDVLPSTRTEPNPSAPSRPVADYRDYGRNRDDPSWQDGLSEYRVQESRLPALELADAGDVEEALLRTRRLASWHPRPPSRLPLPRCEDTRELAGARADQGGEAASSGSPRFRISPRVTPMIPPAPGLRD